jgi:hypothetical protein
MPSRPATFNAAKVNAYLDTLTSTHVAALRDSCNLEAANEDQRKAYELYQDAILALKAAQKLIEDAAAAAQGVRAAQSIQFMESHEDYWLGTLPNTANLAVVRKCNLGPGEKLVKHHTAPNTKPIIMVASHGGSLRNPPYTIIVLEG